MTKGRIAFQGELGANSHEACVAAFPDMEPVPHAAFEEAFDAVKARGSDTADHLGAALNGASALGREGIDGVADAVSKRPMTAVAVALGVSVACTPSGPAPPGTGSGTSADRTTGTGSGPPSTGSTRSA